MAQNKGPVIVTLNCEATPSREIEEIDRAEWEAMTPGQRLALIEGAAETHMTNSGGYGWGIDDEDDAAMVGDSVPDPLRDLAEWLAARDWMLVALRQIEGAPAEVLAEAITRARKALDKEG